MSLDVTSIADDQRVAFSESWRNVSGDRAPRGPSQSPSTRTSTDATVHWLPTTAVIAAMATAFDAAAREAEAKVPESGADEVDVRGEDHDRLQRHAPDQAAAEADTDARAPTPEPSQDVPQLTEASEPDAIAAAALFTQDGPSPLAHLAVLLAQGLAVPQDMALAAAAGRVIQGTGGDDILVGGAGDTLLGGAGDDILIATSGMLAAIDGGAGYDQLIYQTHEGVSANLAGRNIEAVTGSDFDDELSFDGASLDSMLDGGAGDDLLSGGAGDDLLTGGAGRDTLFGRSGDDTFYFDTSDARIDGGDGIDTAYLMDTSDLQFDLASSRIEIVYGGDGDDMISALGMDSISTIFGGGGEDVIRGGAFGDALSGGAHNDILHGFGGNDDLSGGAGFDTAWFAGDKARYVLTEDEEGVVIVSDTLGFEGVDTLTGIEQLQFNDGILLI